MQQHVKDDTVATLTQTQVEAGKGVMHVCLSYVCNVVFMSVVFLSVVMCLWSVCGEV